MKKMVFVALACVITAVAANAKTLIAYYSFTNNVQTIVSDLRTQIDADVVRIEPAEKGIDYAANNYAVGSAQISAIRNNPNSADSYPKIDLVNVNVGNYDVIILATPLWWSNMAAPFQTFLFNYGPQMAGKKIGLIVSSASSGISGVVSDAKRLVPAGVFLEPNLWIRSSQTANCHSLTAKWLSDIDYSHLSSGVEEAGLGEEVGVSLTKDGVTVTGDFDNLIIFSINGQKVLDTTHPHTAFSFQPGCYVAQLRKGNQIIRTKLVAQ